MKTTSTIRLALTAFLLTFATFTIHARKVDEPLLPRDGFWVVESQPKSKQCTVRFYTENQTLIYQETINCRLNIARARVKRQLNAALEQAMFVWNATHKMPTERQWVAIQFDSK
ncbi:hypothetical protein IC229_06110 [Spirosoma sp. BT702]|uniref:Uncharacterized protein n=1 Tax=Spirosoma profusum TaxID=2771354 RepID=A0A927ART1_9BACT|nr:hypothetical protein [Spirosoma profusum]MBD2700200.1 hypothetical protein [Spirosoma profusum]